MRSHIMEEMPANGASNGEDIMFLNEALFKLNRTEDSVAYNRIALGIAIFSGMLRISPSGDPAISPEADPEDSKDWRNTLNELKSLGYDLKWLCEDLLQPNSSLRLSTVLDSVAFYIERVRRKHNLKGEILKEFTEAVVLERLTFSPDGEPLLVEDFHDLLIHYKHVGTVICALTSLGYDIDENLQKDLGNWFLEEYEALESKDSKEARLLLRALESVKHNPKRLPEDFPKGIEQSGGQKKSSLERWCPMRV